MRLHYSELATVLTYCDSESDDYKIRGHTEYAIATYTVLRVFFLVDSSKNRPSADVCIYIRSSYVNILNYNSCHTCIVS